MFFISKQHNGVANNPPPITAIFFYLLKIFRTVALFNFRNKQGGTNLNT